MKGGFYAASQEAVTHAASFLRPSQGLFSILDPCAGEGAALGKLGDLLGCSQEQMFAIELDDSRAEKIRANLANAHVLAPASFFGCRATMNSFSFIWLNPPFDDGYGGRRVEDRFLLTATDWLMPGGVMALVCPEAVADEYSDVRNHFALYYENCMIVPFPEKHRQFNEVIIFGHKRSRFQADRTDSKSWGSVQAPKGFVFQIPVSIGPKVFRKVEPTERELQHLVAQSPLRSHLKTPPEVKLASPPLALGIGHVALLLASGHLDGVVHPEGKTPHVVRGASRKREYVADVTETENPDGSTTTKTTISQRIELVVRTVDQAGRLRTFLETDINEETPGETPNPERRKRRGVNGKHSRSYAS